MLINFFDKAMIVKVIEVILLSNIKILGAFVPISIGVIEREEDIKKTENDILEQKEASRARSFFLSNNIEITH